MLERDSEGHISALILCDTWEAELELFPGHKGNLWTDAWKLGLSESWEGRVEGSSYSKKELLPELRKA